MIIAGFGFVAVILGLCSEAVNGFGVYTGNRALMFSAGARAVDGLAPPRSIGESQLSLKFSPAKYLSHLFRCFQEGNSQPLPCIYEAQYYSGPLKWTL